MQRSDAQTRALQESEQNIQDLMREMIRFGPEFYAKVVDLKPDPPARVQIPGYFTRISEISDLTPAEMRLRLGLKEKALKAGAAVYRLTSLPAMTQVLPRGYSSLIDGLPSIKEGTPRASGYTHGQMAWQAKLVVPVEMELVGVVPAGTRFEAPMHPKTKALYAGTPLG